jgi:hypothetical protein
MPDPATSRRGFITYLASVGLSSTLLPGVLWARVQEEKAERITAAMLKDALAVAGLDFSDEQRQQILAGVNQNLTRYAELRQIQIDPNIAPPLYYSPLVPGTRLDRTAKPFRPSAPPVLRRPANLEDVAFWPLAHLAQLLKTRQVTSRAHADVSRSAQPLQRHAQLRRHLHRRTGAASGAAGGPGSRRGSTRSAAGMPWCKDIIGARISDARGDQAPSGQVIDTEATVVRLLREAGAGKLAKLTTEQRQGTSGSAGAPTARGIPSEGSADRQPGPASATAAGCVVRDRHRKAGRSQARRPSAG